jgi:hypothetical protein
LPEAYLPGCGKIATRVAAKILSDLPSGDGRFKLLSAI